MQSAEKLIERVQKIVKDGSFGPSFILDRLNDGLMAVVMEVSPPDLVVIDGEVTFAIGDKVVDMPGDFLGPRVNEVYNSTIEEKCSVYYRFSDFVHISKIRSPGDITHVCIKGKKIHAAGIPLRENTLLVHYLSTPPLFSSINDNGSNITFLPDLLGEEAIVAYAASSIFMIIEDGIDGKQYNTDKHLFVYKAKLEAISSFFGMESKEREPEQVRDMIGISGPITYSLDERGL